MADPWDCSDVAIAEALAAALIAAAVPALAGEPLALLDEGWGSRVFVVHEWLFRFPKRRSAAGGLAVEIELLPRLELPVAIPRFEHAGGPALGCPYGFVGYRRLPGIEAQVAWPDLDAAALGAALGRVLAVLHRFPRRRAPASRSTDGASTSGPAGPTGSSSWPASRPISARGSRRSRRRRRRTAARCV